MGRKKKDESQDVEDVFSNDEDVEEEVEQAEEEENLEEEQMQDSEEEEDKPKRQNKVLSTQDKKMLLLQRMKKLNQELEELASEDKIKSLPSRVDMIEKTILAQQEAIKMYHEYFKKIQQRINDLNEQITLLIKK